MFYSLFCFMDNWLCCAVHGKHVITLTVYKWLKKYYQIYLSERILTNTIGKKNVYWMYERLYEHSKRDLFSIWSLYEFHSFTLSLELTQLMIFGVFGRFTAVTLHSNSFAVFFFICNFNILQKLARERYKYLYRIFSWASSRVFGMPLYKARCFIFVEK